MNFKSFPWYELISHSLHYFIRQSRNSTFKYELWWIVPSSSVTILVLSNPTVRGYFLSIMHREKTIAHFRFHCTPILICNQFCVKKKPSKQKKILWRPPSGMCYNGIDVCMYSFVCYSSYILPHITLTNNNHIITIVNCVFEWRHEC